MENALNGFDKDCLRETIEIARDTAAIGNYPVGAILAINNKVIDRAGNQIDQGKSFVNHAENTLIIRNGTKLFQAWKNNESVALYSTLEPCVQCLGASVTNRINKIFYIQKDPHGGACDMRHDNIGSWYQKTWPEIIYAPISREPLEMMLVYFRKEIVKGNLQWPTTMMKLLDK